MIVFIRHAQTIHDSSLPASQWQLAEEANQACQQLAFSLSHYDLRCVVTSKEFKSKETGRILAEVLNIPCEEAENLHEHERGGVAFMDARTFQQTVQAFFAEPDQLIFGQETANQALRRFDQAVKQVLLKYPDQWIVIVTHASVLSLFVAHYNALNAYQFWQNLTMPDKVITNSDFKVLQH